MTHPINTLGSSNNRTALWDNVKFVMITFMVIGHFADGLSGISDTFRSIYLFIYAFHMPLFFFISGLFYSERNTKRKIVYYASCGFALKIALTCTTLITEGSASFSLLSDAGIPWFMFSLAIYHALMYLFKDINRKYILIFSFIIACFAGYDPSIGDWLYLSRSIVFFPLFLLGTMLAQQKIINFKKEHFRILLPVSIFVIALWFYLCFFQLDHFYVYRHLFTGRNPFNDLVIGYGPLARLLCYFITFVTGAGFLVIIPSRKLPAVTSMGARTLNVFFWHCPIFMLMVRFLNITGLFYMGLWGKAAYLLIAVLLSVAIMAVRYLEYPLKLIKNACFKKQ